MLKQAGLMLVLCAGLCAAEESAQTGPDKPSAVTEIDARVVSVDQATGQLTVKDTKDSVVKVWIVKNTAISSPGNSNLTIKDLKAKDPVHIYYTSADHLARQIDISPARPVLHDLGTP